MSKMDFNYFVSEVKRTFRVLPVYAAELQNETDIRGWFVEGYITLVELSRLVKINHEMAKRKGV